MLYLSLDDDSRVNKELCFNAVVLVWRLVSILERADSGHCIASNIAVYCSFEHFFEKSARYPLPFRNKNKI